MQGITIDFPSDLEEKLQIIVKSEIGIKAVEAAVPIAESAMKSELEKHHRAKRDPTYGEMAESVKATEPKENEYGAYAYIRPTGTDSKGVRNMEKLAYLEYGTVKQAGTPVMANIKSEIEKEVVNTMQKVIEQEVKP